MLRDELPTAPKEVLGKLAELLERNGISVDDIGRIQKVNVWQGFHKTEDGAELVDLVGVSLSPSWESGPEWPTVQQGPVVKIPAVRPKAQKVTGWETCVVLPDIQFGYYRTVNDQLEPIHDERALSIALQIVQHANPHLVVLLGDNFDGVEFGKYRHTPAWQRTTQATIDRMTVFLAELRSVAPNARIVYLAGNHDERMATYIVDNAVAAFGLRKGASPGSWPVLSIPFLCRMDEVGVEFVPGYPASQVWINNRLKCVHGTKVRSGGSTAHAYLATEKVSTIFGHVHRREYAARTREDWDGAKEIMAASPGTLARRDGAVPSTKGGFDLDGRPLPVVEDWQQGLAVVRFEPGDGRFAYEQVAIHDGWCVWAGQEFVGC